MGRRPAAGRPGRRRGGRAAGAGARGMTLLTRDGPSSSPAAPASSARTWPTRWRATGTRSHVLDTLARAGRRSRTSPGSAAGIPIACAAPSPTSATPRRCGRRSPGRRPVFHLAAQVAVTTSVTDPVADFEVNARGTLNVLEARAPASRCRRPSSSPAPTRSMATSPRRRWSWSTAGWAPRDPRAAGTASARRSRCTSARPMAAPRASRTSTCSTMRATFGVPAGRAAHELHLRPAPVRHRGSGLGRAFPDPGAGRASRSRSSATAGRCATSCTSATPCAPIVALLERIDALKGRAFNLGGGPANAVSLRDLLAEIEALLGRPVLQSHAETRVGDQPWFVSDTRALAEATGWHARLGWRDGLRDLARLAGTRRSAGTARKGGCVRVALVNPPWSFDGSIYFGCRDEHLPLELGYAGALLERRRAQAQLFDGALDGLDIAGIAGAVAAYAPDMTVVTTAPTYLFWRCAQPELRVPRVVPRRSRRQRRAHRRRRAARLGDAARDAGQARLRPRRPRRMRGGGASSWPRGAPPARSPASPSMTVPRTVVTGAPRGGRLLRPAGAALAGRLDRPAPPSSPPLRRRAGGPGAEVEASRGCPYNCSFCAKIDFRDKYRRRDLAAAGRGDRRADRAGRRVPLLRRRDLPALEGAARASCARARCGSASRRASTCGSPR